MNFRYDQQRTARRSDRAQALSDMQMTAIFPPDGGWSGEDQEIALQDHDS